MKKYLWFLSLVVIIGCDHRMMDPFGGTSSQKAGPPELNEQFILTIGQTVKFENEGLSIRFESVPMDCRCPSGVLCIWAGYAEVNLKATNSYNESVIINVGTAYPAEQTVSFFSSTYTVELLELMPYPIADQQRDSTAYKALLIVKRMNIQ